MLTSHPVDTMFFQRHQHNAAKCEPRSIKTIEMLAGPTHLILINWVGIAEFADEKDAEKVYTKLCACVDEDHLIPAKIALNPKRIQIHPADYPRTAMFLTELSEVLAGEPCDGIPRPLGLGYPGYHDDVALRQEQDHRELEVA